MSELENGETLAFRDLPKADIYNLAYVEDDIRNQAAEIMGRAAFSSNPDSFVNQAKQLIKNQQERDYEWLTDQASLREAVPVIPIEDNPDIWLRIHFSRTGITKRSVARKLGISEGQMSAIVKGRRECPEKSYGKLKDILGKAPTRS